MVQIIEENRRPQPVKSPSNLDRLKNALSHGVGVFGDIYSREHERKQREQSKENKRSAIANYLGIDLPQGMDEEDFKEILKSGLSENRESGLQREKYELESGLQSEKKSQEIREKTAPLKNALSAIDEMRKLRKKGNLGIFSSFQGLVNPETLKDKGKYQTLGNSLIQFASSIPIRNRQEFEKLAGHLGDPNIRDAEAAGILDAMESIIRGNMSQYEIGEDQDFTPSMNSFSKKPPITTFLRK